MQISAPGCRWDELYFGKTQKIYILSIAAWGMGGCLQVCTAASDEPDIHESTSDVVCRDSG